MGSYAFNRSLMYDAGNFCFAFFLWEDFSPAAYRRFAPIGGCLHTKLLDLFFLL
jgi:hypothetical protein